MEDGKMGKMGEGFCFLHSKDFEFQGVGVACDHFLLLRCHLFLSFVSHKTSFPSHTDHHTHGSCTFDRHSTRERIRVMSEVALIRIHGSTPHSSELQIGSTGVSYKDMEKLVHHLQNPMTIRIEGIGRRQILLAYMSTAITLQMT